MGEENGSLDGKPAVVPLGNLVSLSSGDFINAADYKSGVGAVTVVGAGGPIGTTARTANTPAPAVVIGRVGAAGATHYFDEAVFATDNTLIAEPIAPLRPRFLYHFLRSVDWDSLQSGSSQPLINQRTVKTLEIPQLGSDAQDKITRLIDGVEESRKSAQDHLGAARRAIERFRHAVLTAACSGRLTAEWRGSNDLVEWQRVRLDEVCQSITDGDHQAPPQVATGIPFITIAAINEGRLRLEKATRSVPPSYYEGLKPARRPRRGDVLFSVTGSIAIPALVETDDKFTFQRHIAILRPDTSRISSKYLFHGLGSSEIRKQGLTVATGTAQLTIPLAGLRSFVISLPPITEQEEIVRRTEELFELAERLANRVGAAQRRVDRSSQAVLAKAFRGELQVNGSTE